MNFKPAYIGKNTKIGKNVKFGINVILYDNVTIGDNTSISHNCVIGDTDMNFFKDNEYTSKETIIGEDCFIRPFTMISHDVIIGNKFQCGDKVMMRSGTRIGNNCSIGTMSDLQGNLKIGNFVRFHSNVHIGMLTEIEDYVWIYPFVVITNDPCPPMGVLKGVKIKEFAQIGAHSVVMPDLEIGENSLVGAGSTVTKNVPESRVFFGSPAKDFCSITELKDTNGDQFLPWRDHLKEFRGLPWQAK